MNISGSPDDRRNALYRAVTSDEPIDAFVGDWMSELNMSSRAYSIVIEGKGAIGHELSSLEALEPDLPSLTNKKIYDLGYPIAEIAHDGDVVIVKPVRLGGLVSIETCKKQLLYGIQGK
jgi:hypothetical protein